jgi:hypothetical protein
MCSSAAASIHCRVEGASGGGRVGAELICVRYTPVMLRIDVGRIHPTRVLVTVATLLAVVGTASETDAQDASRLSVVNRVAGQVVFIERQTEQLTAGRVVSATDDSLLVQIGGVESRIAVGVIRQVYLPGRDAVKNGALIGAGSGAFMGAFACQGGSDRCSVGAAIVGSAAVFGALGAWI